MIPVCFVSREQPGQQSIFVEQKSQSWCDVLQVGGGKQNTKGYPVLLAVCMCRRRSKYKADALLNDDPIPSQSFVRVPKRIRGASRSDAHEACAVGTERWED
jgi:hypothetical protein